MLQRFRFGEKCCKWINSCIRTSFVVNGDPSFYFKVTGGLGQGDTLSPQLFIIAIEVWTNCCWELGKWFYSEDSKWMSMSKQRRLHIFFTYDTLLLCEPNKDV